MRIKERGRSIFARLVQAYPDTGTFLNHRNEFELLVATVLSAQCTDERVNSVTPGLFLRFPTPEAFSVSHPDVIVESIRSISFCYAKATHIFNLSCRLLSVYSGKVPDRLSDLITLAGVGRKTANVVLGQAFGQPGITVDTHVKRLSRRLGFTRELDPVKIERDLMRIWDKSCWSLFSSVLILHGRRICEARKALCESCVLSDLCPSFPNPSL